MNDRWTKTKEYEDFVMRWLSDDDYVTLQIERIKKNKFMIFLSYSDLRILQMGPFDLSSNGDRITITGLRVKLERNAVDYK